MAIPSPYRPTLDSYLAGTRLEKREAPLGRSSTAAENERNRKQAVRELVYKILLQGQAQRRKQQRKGGDNHVL